MIVRKQFLIQLLAAILVVYCLSSCVHYCCYVFAIRNNTDQTISITTSASIQNYAMIEIDNYKTYSKTGEAPKSIIYDKNKNITFFTIPSYYEFSCKTPEWESRHSLSSPKEDGKIPLWEIIKKIEVGGKEVSPSYWKDESNWKMKSYEDDVYRDYTLVINQDLVSDSDGKQYE